MVLRSLGRCGLEVSPIGFGAFKIGRNQKTKYPQPYDLPDLPAVEQLLEGVLALGINYIDTAPAYGLSEERIGACLSHRRRELVLSTKVGERFENGQSIYEFSADAAQRSIERSLQRLRTDVLDLVFIHSDGNDLHILDQTDVPAALDSLKQRGLIRATGFSGKTEAGARRAMEWADVLMIEYHLEDRSHEALLTQARERGVGVVVKKGLASGHLPAEQAIRFVLKQSAVGSMVIGGLNLKHLQQNVQAAQLS